jgi:hypothetical protein
LLCVASRFHDVHGFTTPRGVPFSFVLAEPAPRRGEFAIFDFDQMRDALEADHKVRESVSHPSRGDNRAVKSTQEVHDGGVILVYPASASHENRFCSDG